MTIKIEKGVPMPASNRGTPKYPWTDMEIGDSFFMPDIALHKASGHYSGAGKRLGRKFSGRTEGDGVRVWRTA